MIATWRWEVGDELPNGHQLGMEWLGRIRAALDHNELDVHAQSRGGSADQAEYQAKYLTHGLPPKAHVLRLVAAVPFSVAVYVRRAVNRKWAPAAVFCWPGRECRRTPTFRPERVCSGGTSRINCRTCRCRC